MKCEAPLTSGLTFVSAEEFGAGARILRAVQYPRRRAQPGVPVSARKDAHGFTNDEPSIESGSRSSTGRFPQRGDELLDVLLGPRILVERIATQEVPCESLVSMGQEPGSENRRQDHHLEPQAPQHREESEIEADVRVRGGQTQESLER